MVRSQRLQVLTRRGESLMTVKTNSNIETAGILHFCGVETEVRCLQDDAEEINRITLDIERAVSEIAAKVARQCNRG